MDYTQLAASAVLVILGITLYVLIDVSFDFRKDVARGEDPWDLDYAIRMFDRRSYDDRGKRFHTGIVAVSVCICIALFALVFG